MTDHVTYPTAEQTAAPSSSDRLGLFTAYVVVFVASACTLILEIVAGRLLAPYIGVSLYTWTTIIGVVLAGISLGNYLGGRLADSHGSRRMLGLVLLLGGLSSIAILPLSLAAGARHLFRLNCTLLAGTPLFEACTPQMILIANVVTLVSIIFFAPSLILGMVSPLVIRLSLNNLRTSGRTVGTIYATSTLGSIVGTFLAGFVLISTFGTRNIVLGVGLTLTAMALVFGGLVLGARPVDRALGLIGIGLLVVAAVAVRHTNALASQCFKETDYFCIKVYDAEHGPNRVLRTLALDHLVHSYSSMTDPTDFEYGYIKVYAEITDYVAQRDPDFRAIFIGGGGYTLPRGLEVMYPRSTIEVVEIDPAVTVNAYQYMGLPPDTRVRSVNMDARLVFEDLAESGAQYDLVFGDAFNDLSVPYHLTTFEFDQRIRTLLKDDGLYLVNVIDKLRGGRFLPAFVTTMRAVFPYVYIMSSSTPWVGASGWANTFVVVGTATPIDPERLKLVKGQSATGGTVTSVMPADLQAEWLATADAIFLTDDFAPADNLVAPLFAERGI